MISIPVLLTVLTGIGATMVREWGFNLGLTPSWMIKVHTGEIFHLEAIYPVLNGVGLLGLIATGMSMAGVFKRKPRSPIQN